MTKQEQIREAFKALAERLGPSGTLLGTVTAVNADEFTCVITDDDSGVEYPDIRLRPVLDEKESITVFPKVGTWALATRIENDEDWMVIAVGEADKWRMVIGTTLVEQDSTGLLIKKGTDSLRDVLSSFIDEVAKIVVLQGTSPDVAALTQIKEKLQNVLKNAS